MEEEIIQLMQMQDFAGLALFIDEYSDSIYKTIYSILAYPNERPYFEDVMNEVLYEIWKRNIYTILPKVVCKPGF